MEKLVIDASLAGKLASSADGLELFDASNQHVGYFIPTTKNNAELYAWAKTLWTDEEIEELGRQSGGRTTAEVLNRLAEL